MSETTVPVFTGTNTISNDVSCTQCGYNLRGLTPEGRCPECNTAVARSLQGRLLRFADPAWLDRVRLGTALMLWGLVANVVVGLIAGVLAGIGLPAVIGQLAMVGGAALAFAAVMLVTTPEPAATLDGSDLTVRKVVRICATLALIGTAIQQFTTPTVLMALITGVLLLAGAINHFCFCLVLKGFADRVPDLRLSGQIRTVMWGYAICTGLTAIGGAIAVVAMGITGGPPATATTPTMSPGMALVALPACAVGLGMLVFGIWYLVILIRIHKVIGTAAGQARRTLADPTMQAMAGPAVADTTQEPPPGDPMV